MPTNKTNVTPSETPPIFILPNLMPSQITKAKMMAKWAGPKGFIRISTIHSIVIY